MSSTAIVSRCNKCDKIATYYFNCMESYCDEHAREKYETEEYDQFCKFLKRARREGRL